MRKRERRKLVKIKEGGRAEGKETNWGSSAVEGSFLRVESSRWEKVSCF
jgi:hypothetical protein